MAHSFSVSRFFRSQSRTYRTAKPPQRSAILRLEWLESRVVLAAGDLRIANYNIASVQRSVPSSLGTIFEAIGTSVHGGISRPLDVIALQEVVTQATTTQSIVDQLNSIYGAGTYARGTLNGIASTGGNDTVGLIYNTSTIKLLEEKAIGIASGSQQPRQTIRYRLQPLELTSNYEFYLYNSHFKANDTATDQNRRQIEATAIRADADALGASTYIVYAGDYNVSGAAEAAFQTMIGAGNGRAIDPANRIGEWRNNASFKDVFTQAPAFNAPDGLVGGGLDDRFDFQLLTDDWFDGQGMEYRSNSYRTFANNGSVRMNASINDAANTALADLANRRQILDLLATVTDHLPVVVDYYFAAGTGKPTDITLSAQSIKENEPVDTAIGELFTADTDTADSFVYSLVAGDGDTNNSAFKIVDNQLVATQTFNFETQASLSIRVEVTDSANQKLQKRFVIDVTNVNEAPTAVPGGPYVTSTLDSLQLQGSGSDPDSGQTLSFAWDLNYDGSRFDVDQTGASPTVTFGTAGQYVVALRVSDSGNPALSEIKTTTVTASLPPKVDPLITWNQPSDIVYGSRLSSTQLSATSTVPGTFSYTPPLNSLLDAGQNQTLSVTFTPTDTQRYNAVTRTTTLTVLKATPTVSWSKPADIDYGTALGTTQLNAQSVIAGSFRYAPAAGTILNSGDKQTLSATFTPTDTKNYLNANVTTEINVLQAIPSIQWTKPASIFIGQALSAQQLSATANVPGTFDYTPPIGTRLPEGLNQTLSVTFTPTDRTNYQSSTKTVNIDIIAPFLDYGDAPLPYPVTLLANGARHTAGSLFLGGGSNAEADGTASNTADHDDDDGVVFVSSLVAGSTTTIAGVHLVASAAAKLDAWIDFNQDGDWLDSGEQIFISRALTSGPQWLGFNVPVSSLVGTTFARFRLSSAGGLTPNGLASDGEVEDYQVQVIDGLNAPAVVNTGLANTLPTSTGAPALSIELNTLALVKAGDAVIFQVPVNRLSQLEVTASDSDDAIQVKRSEGVGLPLTVDGAMGRNQVSWSGTAASLDLTSTQNLWQQIDTLDLRGDGATTLTLSPETIKGLNTQSTLHLALDRDDSIQFGNGWVVQRAEMDGSQFVHKLTAPSSQASLLIRNDNAHQNPLNRFDVDRDGTIRPLDALRIINQISRQGATPLTVPTQASQITGNYVDVSGDNRLTALDALRVINAIARMNRNQSAEGESPTLSASSDLLFASDELPQFLESAIEASSTSKFKKRQFR